jgi:hypothetical protein
MISKRRLALTLGALCVLAVPAALALSPQEYVDPTATKSWGAIVLGYINGSSQAIAVSATNPLPVTGTISLPTGAATAANQSTEITSLSTIATNTATGMRVQAGATKVVGVQFTRPANTTAYAAGQAICTSTSTDCPGLVFAGASRVASGGGIISGVQLIKSTTSTTNASFTVEIYQAAPTLTGIKDASTYSPTFADTTSGAFRGAATCTSPTVNGDNAAYQCTLANANGTLGYDADASSQIYAVIQANAAYTPGNGEKFQVNLTFLED